MNPDPSDVDSSPASPEAIEAPPLEHDPPVIKCCVEVLPVHPPPSDTISTPPLPPLPDTISPPPHPVDDTFAQVAHGWT